GKGGLRLITNWQVPQIQRDRTGGVFASCFPGLQMAMKHAKNNGDDGEGRFDRRFLFQTLNMGHSQFAQYTGIRGPNSTINLACASATAAFGVAEDWIEMGRADRVIIISADDVTGDDLWEWIGGGFAASGAASTHNVVEETALPFDRRRNGLILGMGAAAFVVERNSQASERGVQPIAELLGTTVANSAYHGTRLDVEHVAQTVDDFMTRMEEKWNLDRHKIAPNTAFFSHETYTPARGGSAQSEVKALRSTFGDSADNLVIANTKGFTGHPMGVGIEDASMLYGMLTGRIPPIANHKETDPELGNLNLSKGGDYPNLEYGLRFGAGFGSQIALSFVRKWNIQGDRIDGKKFMTWVRSLANSNDVVLRLLDGKLVSYVDGKTNLHGGVQGTEWPITQNFEGEVSEIETTTPQIVIDESKENQETEIEQVKESKESTVAEIQNTAPTDVVNTVIEVVVKHTGYPADFVELDQDLEGELGIDTVKQAEIMAEIRNIFNLPVDEDFVLAEYPTLNHMIGYIDKMSGGTGVALQAVATPVVAAKEAIEEIVTTPLPTTPVESTPPAIVDDSNLVQIVVDVVVEHTGYPADFIELDQDLEGELGIDTVKQAEIMADIRTKFSLPVDEDFVLSDYPTLNHMIAYIQRMTGGEVSQTSSSETTITQSPPVTEPKESPQPAKSVVVAGGNEEIESELIEVVVKHTGYPAD
ncbi:MAG: phosphopantetheine-binding protein, partial [Candidatus Thermoplasmatota archaeon]|nr:phosphopantetheine-binding protein [Candidatus Thermoplasmatota archaeon]